MRPAEISSEAIIQAGLALRSSGRNVTGFALRQRVGGGNPNRLKQVWDQYISQSDAQQVQPAELPVEVADQMAAAVKALTDRLNALAIELNDRAVKAAERRVEEVARSASEQRAQGERELADASETVDEMEKELESAKTKINTLELKLSEAVAREQSQSVELAKVRERLSASEEALKTSAEQHRDDIARIQGVLEHERAEFTDEQKKATAEVDRLNSELIQARTKAQTQEAQFADQRKRSAEETHRNTERLIRLEGDRSAAREEAAKLRGEVETMRAQNAALLEALKSLGVAIPNKSRYP